MRHIEFDKIRGDTSEGRRARFEQLVCHLARLDKVVAGDFRRIDGSGGDGGVEAIWRLLSGGVVGYQAKYHLHRDGIDWAKIDRSVQTALSHYPNLERYVIALPCDLTGRRAVRGGSTEGAWGIWDTHLAEWRRSAASRGMTVAFEHWTASELEERLAREEAHHLRRYFFDELVLSRAWIDRHLNRTLIDLHTRYSPDEHVPTSSLMVFDVLFRR
ncbi:MAG TPA: hypothetical protein VGB85_15815, partial [Nannocystis sp.]